MLLSKKNYILVLSCLVFSLAGPITFWLSSRQGQAPDFFGLWNTNQTRSAQDRLSLGDRLLITADGNSDKQAGINAFRAGQFSEAKASFSAALRSHRNDPESLVYLNNANAAIQGNPLKLAVSIPIGGNLNVAREILRGVAQAQDQLNKAGGIGGRLVQVVIANDENDPAIAKEVATQLVQDESIVAVVGHNSSEASLMAAPVYQQGGLVMISPTSLASSLSGFGSHIFRTTPSTRVTAETLANYTVNVARRTKVTVCAASQDKASKSFREDFAWSLAQYGGKLTNVACDFSAADFNPSDVPSQAISAGSDALLLAPSVYTLDQAAEVIQVNRGRLDLLGSQTIYAMDTLQRARANANGMVLAVPWFPQTTPDNSFIASFIADSKRLWGASGNWRTAMAYDATLAVIEGLKVEPSRAQLAEVLSSPEFSFKGATGTIEFLPSGDRSLRGTLVQVRPGRSSGTGYDFTLLTPPTPLK